MRSILSISLAFCLVLHFIRSAPLLQSKSELQPDKGEETDFVPEELSNGRLTDLTKAVVPLDELEKIKKTEKNDGEEQDVEEGKQEFQEEIKEEHIEDEAKGEEQNKYQKKIHEKEDHVDEARENLENFKASEAGAKTKNEPEGEELLEILPNEENENKSEGEREIKLVKRSKRSAQLPEKQAIQLINPSDLEEEAQSSEDLEPKGSPIEVEDENLELDGDQLNSSPIDTSEDEEENEQI